MKLLTLLSLTAVATPPRAVSGVEESVNHVKGPDIAYDYDLNPPPDVSSKCALINVAMDESGSMANEQNFLRDRALPNIIETLYSDDYQYDHVFVCSNGFGLSAACYYDWHCYRFLGCSRGLTNGDLTNSSIVDSWVNDGGWEEGYYAMVKAMVNVNRYIDGYDLNMDCGALHRNMILVTDEDRDDDYGFYSTVDDMRVALDEFGYILNVVVDATIDRDQDNVGIKISTNSEGTNDNTIFKADGSGGYTTYERNNEDYTDFIRHEENIAKHTNKHYLPLIIDKPGASWNINSLRDDPNPNPILVDSFTKAFTEIKVEEIAASTPSPTLTPSSGPTSKPTSAPSSRPSSAPSSRPSSAPSESGLIFDDLDEDGDVDDLNNELHAGGKGDPHFKSWKGEHFEFHGQCDLCLAKDQDFADGLGLNIQIRTKVVRFWSYIQSAAIRIGDDILEIQGTTDYLNPHPIYRYNFEPYQGDDSLLDAGLGGFPVTITKLGEGVRAIVQYTIDLSSKYPGQVITIETLKEFVKVDFKNPSFEAFGNTVGILGDFKTGKTFARDQKTVLEDFTKLGVEWQVHPEDDRLFHDLSSKPQFPEPCLLPEDPRGERRRRRLGDTSITVEQAEAACSKLSDPMDVKDCVYDVLATQDLDMVGAI